MQVTVTKTGGTTIRIQDIKGWGLFQKTFANYDYKKVCETKKQI
jgi:hypothetical protein